MSYLILKKDNRSYAMYRDKITNTEMQYFEKQGFEIKVIK